MAKIPLFNRPNGKNYIRSFDSSGMKVIGLLFYIPFSINFYKWIVGNLPKIIVRISNVTTVASPKDLLGFLNDAYSLFFKVAKKLIDLFFASGVKCKCKGFETISLWGYFCILSKFVSLIAGEIDAIQVHKKDILIALLTFLPAEYIQVEVFRFAEVRYSQGYDG